MAAFNSPNSAWPNNVSESSPASPPESASALLATQRSEADGNVSDVTGDEDSYAVPTSHGEESGEDSFEMLRQEKFRFVAGESHSSAPTSQAANVVKPSTVPTLAASEPRLDAAVRLEGTGKFEKRQQMNGLSDDVKKRIEAREQRSQNPRDVITENDSTPQKTVDVKVKWRNVEVFSKFTVPEHTGFTSLIDKIKASQPDFHDLLAHKDDSGDMVLLSSDAEFAQAASLKSSQPALRLYAISQGVSNPPKQPHPTNANTTPSGRRPASDEMVKVKWEHHGRYRRLEIPAEIEFTILVDMLKNLEPTFHEQLAWKDEEGDVTVISSSVELDSAISSSASKDLLRLFTYSQEETADTKQNLTEPVEPTVVPNSAPAELADKVEAKPPEIPTLPKEKSASDAGDGEGKQSVVETQNVTLTGAQNMAELQQAAVPTERRRKAPGPEKAVQCAFCEQNHYSNNCTTYSTVDDRTSIAEKKKLCFNCLSSNHKTAGCKTTGSCHHCAGPHNTAFCKMPKNSGSAPHKKSADKPTVVSSRQAQPAQDSGHAGEPGLEAEADTLRSGNSSASLKESSFSVVNGDSDGDDYVTGSEDDREEHEKTTRNAAAPEKQRTASTRAPKIDYVKELRKQIHELMGYYGMEIHDEETCRTAVLESYRSETSSDSDKDHGRKRKMRSLRKR